MSQPMGIVPLKKFNSDLQIEEELEEVVRKHVTNALDEAVKEVFGIASNSGWQDADLPELFQALNKQVKSIMKRVEI